MRGTPAEASCLGQQWLGEGREHERASLFSQRPAGRPPVVRRADPACPGESGCKSIRRDRVSCLGPYNDAVQLRASEAKRVSCNRGLYGRAERAERETEAVEDSL